MLHTKFQPNILSYSQEKVDFDTKLFPRKVDLMFFPFLVSAATRLSFIILKPCSLVMLHMKLITMDAVVSENFSFKRT